MRLDLGLWLAGDLLVLIAGLLCLLLRAPASATPAEPRNHASAVGWGLWVPPVLTCLGLASVVAGLAARIAAGGSPLWPASAWPGGTSADAVAMLAGGALTILAWLLFGDIRRARAADSDVPGEGEVGPASHRARTEALALFGSCLLVFLAVGAAWNGPLPAPAPQVGSWLFGLRVVAASLGLGAWLPAFANAVGAPRREEGSPGAVPQGAGLDAMRAAYPWLAVAWLLGVAWNLATVASLWRGLAPEALLLAACLLAGIYLIACWGAHPVRLPAWALILLTAFGMAAAVLQAWLTPLLLS